MACALTQGFVLDCKESLGGVKSVRFVEFDNVASIAYAAGVATLTMDAGKKFWLYSQVRETSSLTETITANVQNGTIFYQQEVVVVLNKLAAATRNEILLLAKNRLMAIVEDMNGAYWLIGAKNGLDITSGNSATGTASGDRNGYTLTFQAMEADPMWSVSAAAISALTN
jgi:formyltetrahydrofolate synthetase